MFLKSWHTRFALRFAGFHWLLIVITQAIALYCFLTPQINSVDAIKSVALLLPFMQHQAIAASLAIGIVAALSSRAAAFRWLFFLVYLLVLSYVVANQLFYGVFLDHFTLSAGEGAQSINPMLMVSSVQQALNASFAVSAAVAFLGAVWLGWRWVWRGPVIASLSAASETAGDPSIPQDVTAATPAAAPYRTATILAAFVALLFFAGWSREDSPQFANLQRYPAWVLAQDVMQPAAHTGMANATAATSNAAWAALADLGSAQPPDVDTGPAQAKQAILQTVDRPNVLLIVMESVGSQQVLDSDGMPRADVTPHIRRLAEQGVVFDSVYSIFPGTSRTHSALNTGGAHPTWGSVYDVFIHQYTGPMLGTAFAAAGYETALFSPQRLDGEYMDRFMRQAGYETYYDFAEDKVRQTSDFILNSWGAREEVVLPMIEQWIDKASTTRQPFFLNYLTVATHHPYSVPPGYPKPFGEGNDFDRFRNALHYSDAGIGRLIDYLESKDLLDKTIIAITGDHGESFGEHHPLNLLHKHHIYEENIKSFLIVSHPAIRKGVVSRRVGTTGNIMATLMSTAGLEVPDIPGRDMTVASYPAAPVFFHKSATPERWGLRDGKWKFMANMRLGPVELYDLEADPAEQNNLAIDEPKRVDAYIDLCRQWYMDANRNYVSKLDGFEYNDGVVLTAEDLVTPGPKSMSVGYRDPKQDNRFISHPTIKPEPRPELCVRWVPFEFDFKVRYVWIAPDGERYTHEQSISKDWVNSYMPFPGPVPMQPGTWQVTVHLNDKPQLSATFEVQSDTIAQK